MGLTNKINLISQANLIRYEVRDGQNTAERIGKVFLDIIENTDQSLQTETKERESSRIALMQAINGIGILSFNVILQSGESLFDDGSTAIIAYSTDGKTFIATSKVPTDRLAEYNDTIGTPRSDRLFRCGNQLYRWDGTELITLGSGDKLSDCLCDRINEETIDSILQSHWGNSQEISYPVGGLHITTAELDDLLDDGDGEAVSAPGHDQRIKESELDVLLNK